MSRFEYLRTMLNLMVFLGQRKKEVNKRVGFPVFGLKECSVRHSTKPVIRAQVQFPFQITGSTGDPGTRSNHIVRIVRGSRTLGKPFEDHRLTNRTLASSVGKRKYFVTFHRHQAQVVQKLPD